MSPLTEDQPARVVAVVTSAASGTNEAREARGTREACEAGATGVPSWASESRGTRGAWCSREASERSEGYAAGAKENVVGCYGSVYFEIASYFNVTYSALKDCPAVSLRYANAAGMACDNRANAQQKLVVKAVAAWWRCELQGGQAVRGRI